MRLQRVPHLYTKLLTKPTLHSGSSSQPFKCCSIWNPCLSPVWLQPAFGRAPDKAVAIFLGTIFIVISTRLETQVAVRCIAIFHFVMHFNPRHIFFPFAPTPNDQATPAVMEPSGTAVRCSTLLCLLWVSHRITFTAVVLLWHETSKKDCSCSASSSSMPVG